MNILTTSVMVMFLKALSFVGLLTVTACSALPTNGNQQSAPLEELAQTAYTSEDWPQTESLYSQLLKDAPTNARYWYRVAVAQRYLGRFEQALDSLKKGEENGLPTTYADYERAKVAATQGRSSEAVSLLQAAASAGLSGKERVLENDHLAMLDGVEGFDEMLDLLDANANPCRDSQYHAFDFWLGTWEVKDANGVVAGVNSITSKESGCMLLEEWSSATGGTGTSMNYYDALAQTWTQVWISPGLQLKITGGMEDGSMVLTGKAHYIRQGTTSPFRGRWTLLEDGRVRQYFEQQDADGNWSTWFEGFYTRVVSKVAVNHQDAS